MVHYLNYLYKLDLYAHILNLFKINYKPGIENLHKLYDAVVEKFDNNIKRVNFYYFYCNSHLITLPKLI
jgi:hypothetical protein